jgi:signal transduction histidine kinase
MTTSADHGRRLGDTVTPHGSSPRDVVPLGSNWRTATVLVGLALLIAVILTGPKEHRLLAAGVGALLIGGHLVATMLLEQASPTTARVGTMSWLAIAVTVLVTAPQWAGAETALWALVLPAVAQPAFASSMTAGIVAVVLAVAAGAGLFIAGAGSIAGIAAAAIAGVGVFVAAERRRGEAQRDSSRRHETELTSLRTELRDLRAQHIDGAEGRIVALTRANQALQGEVERGRRVLEQALDASRTKTSFLLKISHELRTPLNAIVGYTELLLEHSPEDVGQEVRADLERILSAAHELLGLIDSVLDLARLEAGKFELQVEEFALGDLVHEAIATVTPLADRSGNKLKLKISRELGKIRSDRTRLRQVVVQLLNNACKFTHGGHVELRVEPMATPSGIFYLISVRDTGVGIDPTYLPRLFTPFSQADDSPTRRFGGLGVGLALCKHYCTLLGGEISAESELGKGSVFRVQVPAIARDPREAGITISAF